MHYEFVASGLSAIAAALSYWSYLQSKKHSKASVTSASLSQSFTSKAINAATTASTHAQSSGYKICGTCGLTVARYEHLDGKIICANCK
jgi:formylmethanofuran dehydrogenase subunit E